MRCGIAEWLVGQLDENVPSLVGIDHGFSFGTLAPQACFGMPPSRETRAAWTDDIAFVEMLLKGTSNNTRFQRFLSWLSGRSQRSCRGESPIGDRFDAWPASVLCTMPHGLHPWAHSSGCSCHSLELNQPADVVAEVHHADLESRSHDAD